MEQIVTAVLLVGLLGYAVVSDLRQHRIPNLLVLLGLVVGLASQVLAAGLAGMSNSALGMLIGFGLFLPMYALGGMAAGDVKLMAMVGAFLSPSGALWAGFFSLMAGGLCGFLIVLVRGQLPLTFGRYWLMLRSWAYFSPQTDEVAGKPFPYSVAILLGTVSSFHWLPLGQ
jgi:prepilin peptidase CpaA